VWLGIWPVDQAARSAAVISWEPKKKLGTRISGKKPAKTFYLDLSATCRNDLKTGIERVARAVTVALLENPPAGYRVEPVYLDQVDCSWGYFRVRRRPDGTLGIADNTSADEMVRPACGDIVLGLDISGDLLVRATAEGFFDGLRAGGARIYFIVYDLLPLSLPYTFPPGAGVGHAHWLSAVTRMDGAVCITQSVADDLHAWFATQPLERGGQPFHILVSHLGADIRSSVPSQGVPDEAQAVLTDCRSRPTFLMVGTIEPRKGYLLALEAFSRLWTAGVDINLVIVGKEGWVGLPEEMRRTVPYLLERLRNHPEQGKRLFWLEGISDEYLEKVYAASCCLLAASEGEGFGLPLIEAAQQKLPIVARDIPVFREVAGENAYYFPQEADPAALGSSILAWLELYRQGTCPQSGTMQWLTWSQCAQHMAASILQIETRRRRLFVDISVVYRNDFRTGIQRVVRAILAALLADPESPFEVVPVYLECESSLWRYKTANISLCHGSLTAEQGRSSSEIDPITGDILLCLDFAGGYVVEASQQALYSRIKKQGAIICFVVYDLLLVKSPEYFEEVNIPGYLEWLGVTSESNGVLCISQAVAADYRCWFEMLPAVMKGKDFRISSFHLGADMISSSPSGGLPSDCENQLHSMSRRPCFLMVGTIEPRKGYGQALSAFEVLWAAGADLILVIVGKQGWMMSAFHERLHDHPELGKRLFWLNGISDEYLEKLYAVSSCLLAASEGEGFGLPLIEAAQHKLPIIARDIPVFREVAGEHAHYFRGLAADDLAKEIAGWLQLHAEGLHPTSDEMPWLTWRESAEQLKRILLDF